MGNIVQSILQNKRYKYQKNSKCVVKKNKHNKKLSTCLQKNISKSFQRIPNLLENLPNGVFIQITQFLDTEEIFYCLQSTSSALGQKIQMLQDQISYWKIMQITQIDLFNIWNNRCFNDYNLNINNIHFKCEEITKNSGQNMFEYKSIVAEQFNGSKNINDQNDSYGYFLFLKNLIEYYKDQKYNISIIVQGFEANGGFQEGLNHNWVKQIFNSKNQYCYCSADIFGIQDENAQKMYKSIFLQGCLNKINLQQKYLQNQLEFEWIFDQLQNFSQEQLQKLFSSKQFLEDIKATIEYEFENFPSIQQRDIIPSPDAKKQLLVKDFEKLLQLEQREKKRLEVQQQKKDKKQQKDLKKSNEIKLNKQNKNNDQLELDVNFEIIKQIEKYVKFFTPNKKNFVSNYNLKYLQFSTNKNDIYQNQDKPMIFSQNDPLKISFDFQSDITLDQIAVIKQIQISRKGEFTRPLKTCMIYSSLDKIETGHEQFKQFENVKTLQNLLVFLQFNTNLNISLTNIKKLSKKSKYYHNSNNNNLQYVIFDNKSTIEIGNQSIRVVGWFDFTNSYKKVGSVDIEAQDMVMGRYFAAQLLDSDPLEPNDTNIDMHYISFKGFYLPFNYQQ